PYPHAGRTPDAAVRKDAYNVDQAAGDAGSSEAGDVTDTAPDTGPACVETMAALEFQAWRHQPGEWSPPSNEEWARLANPHLVSVRLAWLSLHKSKDEL